MCNKNGKGAVLGAEKKGLESRARIRVRRCVFGILAGVCPGLDFKEFSRKDEALILKPEVEK